MRVVNDAKWLRAKRILTLLLIVPVLYCINGFEGTQPMNSPEWLLLLMPALGYMVWNITKHYPR